MVKALAMIKVRLCMIKGEIPMSHNFLSRSVIRIWFQKINAFTLTLRKTILDFVSSSWSRSWESFNASLAVWGETPKIHWMKIPQALSFCFILLKLFLKPLDIWTQVLNLLGMDSLKVHIWNSLFAPSLDSFGEMIVNYQLFPSPISKAASVFTICHISAAVSGYHQI